MRTSVSSLHQSVIPLLELSSRIIPKNLCRDFFRSYYSRNICCCLSVLIPQLRSRNIRINQIICFHYMKLLYTCVPTRFGSESVLSSSFSLQSIWYVLMMYGVTYQRITDFRTIFQSSSAVAALFAVNFVRSSTGLITFIRCSQIFLNFFSFDKVLSERIFPSGCLLGLHTCVECMFSMIVIVISEACECLDNISKNP